MAAPLTYRPFLNRNRVVYALHPDPEACEEVAAVFTEQGFMTSSTQSVDGLARLIDLHRPDVVLIDFGIALGQEDLIGALRTIAFGVRIFLLADKNPDAAQVGKPIAKEDPLATSLDKIKKGESFVYEDGGFTHFFYPIKVGDSGQFWSAGVSVPTAAITAAAASQRNIAIGIGIAALVIILLVLGRI